MSVQTQQLLLTPAQVAEALSIGCTKVYELLGTGEIPSVHIGRARRVSKAVLDEYVQRLIDNE